MLENKDEIRGSRVALRCANGSPLWGHASPVSARRNFVDVLNKVGLRIAPCVTLNPRASFLPDLCSLVGLRRGEFSWSNDPV